MRQPSTRDLACGCLALLAIGCDSKEERAVATSPGDVQPAALPEDAAVPKAPNAAATMDAAPLLAEGEQMLDLDGDGKKELLRVTPTHLHFGDSSLPFTLEKDRVVQPATYVIDIDTSDGRKELLIQLNSYESLHYNIVAYMRESELRLSKLMYTRNLRALGDGRLQAENWFQGTRTDEFYEFQGNEIVKLKSNKKKTKEKKP